MFVLRFKHFSGSGDQLEHVVNSWLEEYDPDIKQMTQTLDSGGRVLISFLYEEGFRGHELRLAAEHGMRGAVDPVTSLESIPDVPLHLSEDPTGLQPTGEQEPA